jgi:hypothetical protein
VSGYEIADVPVFVTCRECGEPLDYETDIRQRLNVHGDCAEIQIARSTEIFKIYRAGGRIEGLFDGVGPP